MSNVYGVCVECRSVNIPCDHEKIRIDSHYKWRPPRKTNDKAWKRIAEGDVWWDKRRIERPMRRRITEEEIQAKRDWYYGKYYKNWKKAIAERRREEAKIRKANKVKKKHNQPIEFDVDEWWATTMRIVRGED